MALALSARKFNLGEFFNIVGIITLLTFIFGICGRAFGAEDGPPIELDGITVTASHIPSSVANKPASITIINRKTIEARQPESTISLLRNVPGLHIDQPGGRGSVSSLYLRGADPNFTVVLIDGIKVNDPTNSRGGSFDFSTLDPDSIERIEIVRGSLSSVYGSDAMAGVIHIVTRQGSSETKTSLNLSFGSDEYHRTGLGVRGSSGISDFALNISYADDGVPIEGSTFIGKNINSKVTLTPSNTTWFQLASHYSESQSESFPDESGGPMFAVLRDLDQRDTEEFTLGMSFNHDPSRMWQYTLKADFYNRGEEGTSPGIAPGARDPFGIPANSSNKTFSRKDVLLNTVFSPFRSTRLSLGIDMQFEKGESEGAVSFGGVPMPSRFELDRTIVGSFFEAEFTSENGMTLEGGLRIDDPDHFESEVSQRVGMLYRIHATKTTLKANWGKGFKLPSFFALGNPIVGNPDLIPETSRSFEAGIIQGLYSERMHLSGAYFQNRFFNLIDFFEGPPPQLINQSKVQTEGFEMEFSLRANDQLSIDSHLRYTKTDIIGSNEKLRNRPKWRGGFSSRWQVKKKVINSLGIFYVGKVHDSSIPTGDHILDDYIRTDIVTTWVLSKNWRSSLAIDNLFDVHYEEAVGFPAPGIRPRIAVRRIF